MATDSSGSGTFGRAVICSAAGSAASSSSSSGSLCLLAAAPPVALPLMLCDTLRVRTKCRKYDHLKDPLDLGGSCCLVSDDHTSVQWFKRANELQQLVNSLID
jgi:hypothetical protein